MIIFPFFFFLVKIRGEDKMLNGYERKVIFIIVLISIMITNVFIPIQYNEHYISNLKEKDLNYEWIELTQYSPYNVKQDDIPLPYDTIQVIVSFYVELGNGTLELVFFGKLYVEHIRIDYSDNLNIYVYDGRYASINNRYYNLPDDTYTGISIYYLDDSGSKTQYTIDKFDYQLYVRAYDMKGVQQWVISGSDTPTYGVTYSIKKAKMPMINEYHKFYLYEYKYHAVNFYLYIYVSSSLYARICLMYSSGWYIHLDFQDKDGYISYYNYYFSISGDYIDLDLYVMRTENHLHLKFVNKDDTSQYKDFATNLPSQYYNQYILYKVQYISSDNDPYGGYLKWQGVGQIDTSKEKKSFFDPIVKVFENIYHVFQTFIKLLITKIPELFMNAINKLTDILQKLNFLQEIRDKIDDFLQYFTDSFKQFFENTIGFFNDLYEDYIEPFVNGFTSFVIDLWNTINNFINWMQNIMSFFSVLSTKVVEYVDFIVNFTIAIFPFILGFGGFFWIMWLINPLIRADLEGFMSNLLLMWGVIMKIVDIFVKIIHAIISLINMLRNMIPLI